MFGCFGLTFEGVLMATVVPLFLFHPFITHASLIKEWIRNRFSRNNRVTPSKVNHRGPPYFPVIILYLWAPLRYATLRCILPNIQNNNHGGSRSAHKIRNTNRQHIVLYPLPLFPALWSFPLPFSPKISRERRTDHRESASG